MDRIRMIFLALLSLLITSFSVCGMGGEAKPVALEKLAVKDAGAKPQPLSVSVATDREAFLRKDLFMQEGGYEGWTQATQLDMGKLVKKEWDPVITKEVFKIPELKTWFYPMEEYASSYGEKVKDEKSLNGWVMRARPNIPIDPKDPYRGIFWHSLYVTDHPVGLYRVFVRMKVPAQPTDKVAHIDLISGKEGLRAEKDIAVDDFKKAGEYEDIYLFDFIKPFETYIALRIFTPGGDAECWVDHIYIVQLKLFTDEELLQRFPNISQAISSEPVAEKSGPPKILIMEGLLGNRYRLPEAVQNIPGWQAERLFYEYARMTGGTVPKFPASWKELNQYQTIVLANAGIKGLASEQRLQLREFVRAGGGALFLGGKASYGSAGLKGSFLEEVLPVEAADTFFDIEQAPGTLTKTDGAFFAGAEWLPSLVCTYIHRVNVKKTAKILARAGDKPFIVSGVYGKGRVVCITGTPYGVTDKGKTIYTDWKDWTRCMRNILLWLNHSS